MPSLFSAASISGPTRKLDVTRSLRSRNWPNTDVVSPAEQIKLGVLRVACRPR